MKNFQKLEEVAKSFSEVLKWKSFASEVAYERLEKLNFCF